MFGGTIEHSSVSNGLEVDEDPNRTAIDSNLGLVYQCVECGQAMTVVQISQSPYLLVFGYGQNKAWGLPKLFMDDKPVHFQAVSNLVYVLTEKSVLYRINCETRAYERIQDKAVD